MQKLLTLLLIIVLVLLGAIVFMTQQYEVIGTNAKDLIIFNRIKCSLIQKNVKGEWEETDLKAGKIDVDFKETEDKSAIGETPVKVPVKKPELKI